MADFNNLLPGDRVDWVRNLTHCQELVSAVVIGKGPKLVGIKFEDGGREFIRYVDPKRIRLVYGGRKRLERELANAPRSYKSEPCETATVPQELLNA